MSIHIIAIGKKHEPWVADGIERYSKRLRRPYDVEWVLLPHSAREGLTARQDESERILAKLGKDDFVVLLDERGELLDSPALAQLFTQAFETHPKVTVIIGGAYGVNDELRHRANSVLSLSPLVFPHQLVRLIVVEQLYRSQEIALGNPYHHV
jgi:23S rRNA (pseudouridine1915-N3)-methyltransferase